jgi:hypothetical protein
MKLTIASALLILATKTLALPRPGNDGLLSPFAANVSEAAALSTPGYFALVAADDPRSVDDLIEAVGVKRTDIVHTYENPAFKGFISQESTDNSILSMSSMTGLKFLESILKVQPLMAEITTR